MIIVSGAASDFVCPAWLNGSLQAVIDKNETFQTLRQELDALLGRGPAPSTDPLSAVAGRQLSPRETEIFALIGEGLTTREIAERLSLSEHTVQTHRKRLAFKSRGRLTRLAIAQRERSIAAPAK